MSKTLNSPQDVAVTKNNICDVKMIQAMLTEHGYSGPVDGDPSAKGYFDAVKAFHDKHSIVPNYNGKRIYIVPNGDFLNKLEGKSSDYYKRMKPMRKFGDVMFCSDADWVLDVDDIKESNYLPHKASEKLYKILHEIWAEAQLPFRYENGADLKSDELSTAFKDGKRDYDLYEARFRFRLHLPDIKQINKWGKQSTLKTDAIKTYLNAKFESLKVDYGNESYSVTSVEGSAFTLTGPFLDRIKAQDGTDACSKQKAEVFKYMDHSFAIFDMMLDTQRKIYNEYAELREIGRQLDEDIKRNKAALQSIADPLNLNGMLSDKKMLRRTVPHALPRLIVKRILLPADILISVASGLRTLVDGYKYDKVFKELEKSISLKDMAQHLKDRVVWFEENNEAIIRERSILSEMVIKDPLCFDITPQVDDDYAQKIAKLWARL